MNAKKVKKLRKEIYGKDSSREREYKVYEKTGVIIDTGRRGKYQRAKRDG